MTAFGEVDWNDLEPLRASLAEIGVPTSTGHCAAAFLVSMSRPAEPAPAD